MKINDNQKFPWKPWVNFEADMKNSQIYNELQQYVDYDFSKDMFFQSKKFKRFNSAGEIFHKCTSGVFMLVLFTELKFNEIDIPTVLFCQELIDSHDDNNIIIAANILVKLKPIES